MVWSFPSSLSSFPSSLLLLCLLFSSHTDLLSSYQTYPSSFLPQDICTQCSSSLNNLPQIFPWMALSYYLDPPQNVRRTSFITESKLIALDPHFPNYLEKVYHYTLIYCLCQTYRYLKLLYLFYFYLFYICLSPLENMLCKAII